MSCRKSIPDLQASFPYKSRHMLHIINAVPWNRFLGENTSHSSLFHFPDRRRPNKTGKEIRTRLMLVNIFHGSILHVIHV